MRRGLIAFGLICGLGLACGERALGENWPRFRGPNGTGIARDREVPLRWSDTENVLWKTTIPGAGNSSPIIWGDRIFLESAPTPNERRLYCLNVADGKVLWSRAVPGRKARTHQKNTLASSTPATDGERVYALFWDGDRVSAHAFDFHGKHLWQRELGAFLSQHGVGASPIVYNGKVFVNYDQDKIGDDKNQGKNLPPQTSRLIALDAHNGNILWQANRFTHNACYSTPFIHEAADEAPEVIVASTAGIMGYEPETGKEKWRWDWAKVNPKMLRTVGSPIYAQGMVLACSGNGPGARHTVAIRKGVTGDVTPSNLAWNYDKAMPYVPTPLAWGDHFYLVTDQGFAACIEIKTGKIVWSEERLGGAVTASPILIDGKVYAFDETGDGFVYEATPKGFKLLERNTLGEGVMATPAVADNRLYIRGREHLFCIGKLPVK